MEGIEGGVAVDPEDVEGRCSLTAAEASEDAMADGAEDAVGLVVTEGGKELVLVAFEEGHVPLDGDAEAFVFVVANGEVGAKEDGEIDAGLVGDAAQQGGLVLDGMTDQVGQPYCSPVFAVHGSAPISHDSSRSSAGMRR